MSFLCVFQDSAPAQPLKVLTHLDDIAATLAEVGVGFERGDANTPMVGGASREEVIAAYASQIERLRQRGYATVDVISLDGYDPQRVEQRARFLDEHCHSEDEVRFFVAGRGLWTLHIEDKVYAMFCEKNDLITVPAATRHWFDMGEQSRLVVIRLSSNPDGWTAKFTGDDIAGRFPRLDDWL